VNLTERGVEQIHTAAATLARELSAKPEIVDPEVPRTLTWLASFLRDPAKGSRRAAFALLRSIENLVSGVFAFGVEFISGTAKKTADSLSTAVSRTVVVSLLSLALAGATQLAPVAGKIGELSWLKNATELVQRQIDKMVKE
jgi:hypothetical protein